MELGTEPVPERLKWTGQGFLLRGFICPRSGRAAGDAHGLRSGALASPFCSRYFKLLIISIPSLVEVLRSLRNTLCCREPAVSRSTWPYFTAILRDNAQEILGDEYACRNAIKITTIAMKKPVFISAAGDVAAKAGFEDVCHVPFKIGSQPSG